MPNASIRSEGIVAGQLLCLLADNGALSAYTVARRMKKRYETVRQMLQRLEKRGWVRRVTAHVGIPYELSPAVSFMMIRFAKDPWELAQLQNFYPETFGSLSLQDYNRFAESRGEDSAFRIVRGCAEFCARHSATDAEAETSQHFIREIIREGRVEALFDFLQELSPSGSHEPVQSSTS